MGKEPEGWEKASTFFFLKKELKSKKKKQEGTFQSDFRYWRKNFVNSQTRNP